MKIDPRDGVAKLMEINRRPGYRIWCEISVGQPPLLCVQIHRGVAVDALPPHEGRDVFLNPIEDTVSLGARLLDSARRRVGLGRPEPAEAPSSSPRALLREYREPYRSSRRHFDWYFRALADDPLAASPGMPPISSARAGPTGWRRWRGSSSGTRDARRGSRAALGAARRAAPGGGDRRPGRRPGAEEDFYRSQTIRIMVNATGGGFDVSARALARHLGRHIPGNPAAVVETMSGAGGLVAANYLYRVARPDGLTLAHFSGDLLLGEVLGRPGIEFDARRFEYIGTGSNEHIACAFSRASGITSLDRWKSARTPVKLGGTAPGSNSDNATRILKAVLGLIQLVSGYKGTAAIRLAVDSGELAGACFNWGSMRTGWQHAIEAGEVVVVLQLAARPLADLPAVSLVTELAKTDDAKRLVATTILRASGLARPYAAPPGTPKDRVQILRRAFLATLRDPEYLAEAGRAKIEVHTRGEDVERLVADLTLDPPTVTRLRMILSTRPV